MGRLRQALNPNQLRLRLNRWLRRFDLGIYRPSVVEAGSVGAGAPVGPPLPANAREELRLDHPRLRALRERYAGHAAASLSVWSDLRLEGQVSLPNFRADNQYLYQARGTEASAYALTTHYVERHGRLGVLDRLGEDGLFGAQRHEIDGRCVSRDLLDSALEIEALADWLGTEQLAKGAVLDIGAGYGRLAHRLSEWSPDVRVVATDAVPLSTFLCDYYLGFRGCPNARALPLDEAEHGIAAEPFDVAVNVHSFGEAPLSSIRWWIDRLAAAGIPRFFAVHVEPELFALEADLSRVPLEPTLAERGYRAVDVRPKFEHSDAVQRHGVFPAWYHLYERS